MRLCVNCQNCGLCDWAKKKEPKKFAEIVDKLTELIVLRTFQKLKTGDKK